MANAPRDENRIPAILAVSKVDNTTPVILWGDPATHELLIQGSLSVAGLATAVTDNEAVNAADTGTLSLGTDGSNYQVLSTDASGHLQVDVLSATSVAVTGTFWQTTQPVSNAGLTALNGAITGTEIQVDVITMPTTAVTGTFWQTTQPVSLASVPSHAVTNAGTFAVQATLAAETTKVIGTINVAASQTIAVTNAGTFATQESGSALTALQLIDNAVSGAGFNITQFAGAAVPIGAGLESTAVRVTLPTNGTGIVGLAAGTNGIGKLTANSGVDIGDVDVISVIPGVGATNLGKAEDGAHTSGDVGVMSLGVRNDTPNAALAATDLDYSPVAVYKTGALRVAPPEEDFAVLGSNSVKKYYTYAGAVTDGIVWSPAAGKRWYVTDIFIQVSAAATVTLEDDLVGGDSAIWKAELAANSGWSHAFSTPWFSGEDAADLIITTSAGNVYCSITGYEI